MTLYNMAVSGIFIIISNSSFRIRAYWRYYFHQIIRRYLSEFSKKRTIAVIYRLNPVLIEDQHWKHLGMILLYSPNSNRFYPTHIKMISLPDIL